MEFLQGKPDKERIRPLTGFYGPSKIYIDDASAHDSGDERTDDPAYNPHSDSDDEYLHSLMTPTVAPGSENKVKRYEKTLKANIARLLTYIPEMDSYIESLPFRINSTIGEYIEKASKDPSILKLASTQFLNDTEVLAYQEIYNDIPALLAEAKEKLKLIINDCLKKISDRITAFRIAATNKYAAISAQMSTPDTIISGNNTQYILNLNVLLRQYMEISNIYSTMYIEAFDRIDASRNLWTHLPKQPPNTIPRESTYLTFFSQDISIITCIHVVKILITYGEQLNLQNPVIPLHRIIRESHNEAYLPKIIPYDTSTITNGASKYLKYKQKYLELKRSMKSLSIN